VVESLPARLRRSAWRLIESPSTGALVDDGLKVLAEDLGASLVVLYRHTDLGVEGASPRAMDSPMPLYTQRYAERCPLQEVKRVSNPQVAVVSDMVSASVLRRSEVVSDFYRPYRIERHLVARLSHEPYGATGCQGIVFCRSLRDRPWNDSDVQALARMRPLIASVVERNRRVAQVEQREREILAGALAEVDRSAMLLLDRDAQPVWMSPTLVERLAQKSVGREALTASLRAPARRLLAFGAAPDTVTIEIDGAPWLRAFLFVTRAAREPFVLARFVEDSAREPEGVAESARQYALTRGETAVLAVLVEGKSNDEIARRLGISYGTVHSHLKSIYQKLGVHTRSEAIVLVTERGRLR
jgi:DNA-binding CsgD family transcriptional regulator